MPRASLLSYRQENDPALKRCVDESRDAMQSPAMKNGRCRMHGGTNPGAPKGTANGNYRHGLYTCEAVEERRFLAELRRAARVAIEEVEQVLLDKP